MNKILTKTVTISICILAVITIVLPTARVEARYSGKADCGVNAMIKCGINSIAELKQRYNENQGGNLRATFDYFHIKNVSYFDGMVKGRVTKTNEVWVGNKKVATGAVTAGRTFMPGSTKIPGIEAYMRNPAVSFKSDSLEAFVKMTGEKFEYAVIMSCGNPVNAHPTFKPKPQPPKPQPQPQPTPQPQPKRPDLEIAKDVRTSPDGEWQPNQVETTAGATVEYRIVVTNTGETELTNVRIIDTLPAGVAPPDPQAALRGSPIVTSLTVDDIAGGGIIISNLPVGQSIEVIFSAIVEASADNCGQKLLNVARAQADNVPEERNDARAKKICQPVQPPAQPPQQPQVQAAVTPPQGNLPVTGAAGAVGIFSVTSLVGVAVYKLKEFYLRMLG